MALQYINLDAKPPRTPHEVAARFNHVGDDWAMTDAERLALTGLLADLRPAVAIEVGVFRAGSLSALASYAEKVYALDIDPSCEARYQERFPNVEFVTGDSTRTLPVLLTKLQAERAPLGFILIDADHSRDGVWRDIESILQYVPQQPLHVVMHDSFNPDCRRGMQEAHWSANPYVHLVELDFVTGRFVTQEEADGYRQMWCGFALAVLLPERRIGKLTIHENESLLFDTVLRHSVYRRERWWNPVYAGHELKHRAKRLLERRAPAVYQVLRRILGKQSV